MGTRSRSRTSRTSSSTEDLLSAFMSQLQGVVTSMQEVAASIKSPAPEKTPVQIAEKEKADLESKIKELELNAKIVEGTKQHAKALEELEEAKDKLTDADIRLKVVQGAVNELTDEETQKLREQRAELEKNIRARKQAAKASELGASAAEKLASSMKITKSSFVENTQALMSKKGLLSAFKSFGSEAKEYLNPKNIVGNYVDKYVAGFKELFTSIDENSAKARKTFGEFGNEISRQSIANEGNLRQFNMSIEESFEIQTSMANSLSIYRKASDQQIGSIQHQIAAFERLGVSTEDSVKVYQTLSTTMGHTPEAADQITRSFLDMSKRSKIPLNTMFKVFNENNKQLLMFGKNANSTAMQLAYLEGNAKLNAGTLADMGDRFMNFEEASKSVSGLNNVLGGTFLSIDEMQQLASKGDIPGMMRKIGGAIEDSGVSIEEFMENPQQVAAAAEELGMPMTELMNNLKAYQRGELDAAEANASLAAQSKLTTQEMDRQAKATMSSKENLEAYEKQLKPAADKVSYFQQAHLSLTAALRDNLSFYTSFTKSAGSLFNSSKIISAGMAKLTAATSSAGAASSAISTASSASSAASSGGGLLSKIGGGIVSGARGAMGLGKSVLGGVAALGKSALGGLGSDIASSFTEASEFISAAKQPASELLSRFTSSTGPVGARLKDLVMGVKNNPVIGKGIEAASKIGGRFAKFVPYLGGLIALGSSVYRYGQGDIKGSLYDIGAAGADMFLPGSGTLINLFQVGRDMGAFQGTSFGINQGDYGGSYDQPKKMAAGSGGFIQGKTNAIIGESGPEMVLPMNKVGAFLAEPIRAAIEQFALNSPTNLNSGVQNTPLNAKIEITLNGQVLKDFVLKTVGAELTPLV